MSVTKEERHILENILFASEYHNDCRVSFSEDKIFIHRYVDKGIFDTTAWKEIAWAYDYDTVLWEYAQSIFDMDKEHFEREIKERMIEGELDELFSYDTGGDFLEHSNYLKTWGWKEIEHDSETDGAYFTVEDAYGYIKFIYTKGDYQDFSDKLVDWVYKNYKYEYVTEKVEEIFEVYISEDIRQSEAKHIFQDWETRRKVA